MNGVDTKGSARGGQYSAKDAIHFSLAISYVSEIQPAR